MKRLLTALGVGVLITASGATAAKPPTVIPLLKIGERTYTNAIISSATPLAVFIRYDGGVAKINPSDLPSGLREQYDDPSAANAFAATQGDIAFKRMEYREVVGQIAAEQTKERYFRYFGQRLEDASKKSEVHGKVLQVLHGEEVLVANNRTGLNVIVTNYPGAVVDGFEIDIYAELTGRRQYTTVNGSTATVLCYDRGIPYKSKTLAKLEARLLSLAGDLRALEDEKRQALSPAKIPADVKPQPSGPPVKQYDLPGK